MPIEMVIQDNTIILKSNDKIERQFANFIIVAELIRQTCKQASRGYVIFEAPKFCKIQDKQSKELLKNIN